MKIIQYVTATLAIAMSSNIYAEKPVMPKILDPNVENYTSTVVSNFKRKGPTIQIGILLDVSGSMEGLINQAKDQLWKIVNEVTKANKNNKDIVIEVGLFEYGSSSLPDYEGYLQMLSPLTSDLDKISKELFAIRTSGSEEYTGKVILESVNRFSWSTNKEDLKLLIIAGNESFWQGDIPYEKAIKKAQKNNIIVNTIFCGTAMNGKSLGWQKAAELGKGKYFSINQDKQAVSINTPYDEKIIALGEEVNNTYINYGSIEVRESRRREVFEQDSNSKKMSKSSQIYRSMVKAKPQYTQAKTDLVAAYKKSASILEKVSDADLPKELKGKTKNEIKKIITEKQNKRKSLEKEIIELEKKRALFIAKESKNGSNDDLGSVIIKSIREQAKNNGFSFSK